MGLLLNLWRSTVRGTRETVAFARRRRRIEFPSVCRSAGGGANSLLCGS